MALLTGRNFNSPDVTQLEVSQKNLLHNGDFIIAQRGVTIDATTTSFPNNDDTYCLDRWVLLSDGNNIVDVTQETSTVPDGSRSAIRLDIETGNQEFGIVQIIENKDCARLLATTTRYVSLSFKVRSAASIVKMGASVLSWDGTADVVTSDVVATWNGASAPSLAADWTLESPAAEAADIGTLSSSEFLEYKIEGIPIDAAGMTNLAVFIYTTDVTATVGEFVYISDVMLNEGKYAAPFEQKTVREEFADCQRYFIKTFDYDRAPVQDGDVFLGSLSWHANGLGALHIMWRYPVAMRIVGTPVTYNPSDTNTSAYNTTDGSDSVLTDSEDSNQATTLQFTTNASHANDYIGVHATVSADL